MTRTIAGFIAIALTAFLIGCGGGSNEATPTPTTGNAPAAAATQSTQSGGSSVAAPTATEASASTSNQPSASTGSTSSGNFDPANCPELQALANAAGLGNAFSGGSVGNIKFDAQTFQKLADNSPSEIKPDMQVLATALGSFFKTLDDLHVDISNPATFATLSQDDLNKLQAAASQLETPEVQKASDNVQAYFQDKCS